MDWDGLCSTSELSSSETCSSDGREADDEQSDWVGPVCEYRSFPLPQTSTRQQRFIKWVVLRFLMSDNHFAMKLFVLNLKFYSEFLLYICIIFNFIIWTEANFRTCTASAALQRKLDRFIRDDSQRELVVKNWTSYRQVAFLVSFNLKLGSHWQTSDQCM